MAVSTMTDRKVEVEKMEFTPVRKRVLVRADPERAFRRFTAEIAAWWPLASHSVSEGRAETVVMEPGVGGRIVERIRGGSEAEWGRITIWDPPRRVAFTWHPGHAPEAAMDVEVRFTAEGEGTRVDLTHTGFERLGPGLARKARKGYPIGWEYVLGLYAERKGLFMGTLGIVTKVMMSLRRRRSSNTTRSGTSCV